MAIVAFNFRLVDYDDPRIDEMPQATDASSEDNGWDIVRQKARDFIQDTIHDTPSNIDDLDRKILKGGCLDENGTTVEYRYDGEVDGDEVEIVASSCGDTASVTIIRQNVGTIHFNARVYA